ncbi:hypothetical protein Hanom_Chr03g00246091 [Helianthus anomalus]
MITIVLEINLDVKNQNFIIIKTANLINLIYPPSTQMRMRMMGVKLQKSSFIYVTYCKLCHLSLIITENVVDVCKPLQVMLFSHNSVNFLWLNLTKWTPHEGILVILLLREVYLVIFNHKNTLVWSLFGQI